MLWTFSLRGHIIFVFQFHIVYKRINGSQYYPAHPRLNTPVIMTDNTTKNRDTDMQIQTLSPFYAVSLPLILPIITLTPSCHFSFTWSLFLSLMHSLCLSFISFICLNLTSLLPIFFSSSSLFFLLCFQLPVCSSSSLVLYSCNIQCQFLLFQFFLYREREA